MLGLTNFAGKFVKQYAALQDLIINAAKQYKHEVEHVQFPTPEYSYEFEIEDRNKADIIESMQDFKELDREPVDEYK
jgi:hypothetical protein